MNSVSLALQFSGYSLKKEKAGVYCNEVPPVPIPNTAVKLIRVEDTWLETAWENRSVPAQPEISFSGFSFYSGH